MNETFDHDGPKRLRHRGFDLRLEGGISADEARGLVDRVLASSGDRIGIVVARPEPPGGHVYLKAEFRRPDQPLGKRLRPGRAVAEGRGYRFFAAAGLRVPRLLLFGEQPRLLPRAGALVGTERVPGRNAARTFEAERTLEPVLDAVTALARVHDAGLVHGDAALRNFVPAPGGAYVLDLPRWAEWTPDGVLRDLRYLVGSTWKHGAARETGEALLDAYAAACARAAELPEGWRGAALAAAAAYLEYLDERDRTRAERHARRAGSLRPGERGAD